MPRKKSKTTRPRSGQKKPGAQPGNKNALRHGFYSKGWKADQQKRLDGQEPTDLQAEIALLRVCLDNLQEELNFAAVYHHDDKGNATRDDHYLRQLNTLAIMTQSISTLSRTQYLIKGKSGDIHDTILHALEELRIEMGL